MCGLKWHRLLYGRTHARLELVCPISVTYNDLHAPIRWEWESFCVRLSLNNTHRRLPSTGVAMRPSGSRPGGFYPGQNPIGPFTPRQPYSGAVRPLTAVLSPLNFPHNSNRLPCGLMDLLTFRGMSNQFGGGCDTTRPSPNQVS